MAEDQSAETKEINNDGEQSCIELAQDTNCQSQHQGGSAPFTSAEEASSSGSGTVAEVDSKSVEAGSADDGEVADDDVDDEYGDVD